MGIFSAPRWDEDSVGSKVSGGSKNLDEKTSAQKKSARGKKRQLEKKVNSPANGLSLDDTGEQASTTKQLKKSKKKTDAKLKKMSGQNSFDKQERTVPLSSGEKLSHRQRRRLNLKMKKLLQSKLKKSSPNNTSNKATASDSPTQYVNFGENSARLQGKLAKLLEIRKKKKKAKKAKENSEGSVNASLDSSIGSSETPEEKRYKAKLKRKERKLKRKESLAKQKELEQANNGNEIVLSKKMKRKMQKIAKQASENDLKQAVKSKENGQGTAKERKLKRKESLAKQKELEQANNGNEIVLSKKKKRKMQKIAKQASENDLKQAVKIKENGQGTENPSFNTSLTDLSTPQTSNDGQLEKKKKRNKKKKKIGLNDSVDGNLVSSSSKFYLDSNDKSSKNIASVTNPDSIADKSLRKKVVIAKLLQESNIKETETLHDLKKKRLQDRNGASNEAVSSKKKKKNAAMSLREKMTEQLKSSRFRWLNEQLYTSNSWEAMKYFKEDPEAFEAYHSGYRNQVAQWPVNPLDVIIESISSLSKDTVVADFGCGEARLAATLPHLKVHSLDLIASQPGVVACDMAHTPLLMESVDVAVFCLSLMGTNLNDFILEANRVLKNGGMLMIAEVESRFEDVDNFTSAMVHFGFQLKKKDLSNQMFIFMDFKKTRKVSKTGKLPALTLEPCVYKKR
ncbi:Ribosomal RNA-processing protein 8 [Frankliniella fusca]|uniref:Ribosomal RNA-processing protein 8 n=1 Tax=Frankliniella fusca TaxID=407009 RepID=A0AAE1HIJ3_9NEOP|nr:Ribosomal RNA-processing protein 8 [Frankliniella fusca]